jgi:hypothetical protein
MEAKCLFSLSVCFRSRAIDIDTLSKIEIVSPFSMENNLNSLQGRRWGRRIGSDARSNRELIGLRGSFEVLRLLLDVTG